MSAILLVDDDTSVLDVMSEMLRLEGHQVTVAENGEQAVDRVSKDTFDLVITDLIMPEMDGISLTREIRNMPCHQLTPILILTTESTEAKKEEGRAAGASGWIVKPFNPEIMLQVIDKALS